jgi:hypothetical protein
MDILTHFKMVDCNTYSTPFQSGVKLTKICQTPAVDVTLYLQLVDGLIYLTHSQPDISFIVSVVYQFIQDPIEIHWKAVKRIFIYLKDTTHLGIEYCRSSYSLVGFTDSN